MRFIYRGARYEATPATLETKEGTICGTYRGAQWRCRTLAETPAPQAIHQLKYRGVSYTTGDSLDQPTPMPQATAAKPQSNQVRANRVRAPKLSNIIWTQTDRLHRSNIQHNIEHRIEVAKARHDNALVALLEREFEEALCR